MVTENSIGRTLLRSSPLVPALITAQIAKLLIILSNPFNVHFLRWFFELPKLPPYDFHAFDELLPDHIGNGPVPYSMLWYTFSQLARLGIMPYFLITYAIDCLFFLVIIKWHGGLYTLYYVEMSTIGLLLSPQDFLPLLFIFLGRVRAFFLPLAIATKLPLIPPILDARLWNFILYDPISLHDTENWARYSLLATAWTISLLLYLVDRGTRLPRYIDGIAWTMRRVFR